jgi:hypothetical protein
MITRGAQIVVGTLATLIARDLGAEAALSTLRYRARIAIGVFAVAIELALQATAGPAIARLTLAGLVVRDLRPRCAHTVHTRVAARAAVAVATRGAIGLWWIAALAVLAEILGAGVSVVAVGGRLARAALTVQAGARIRKHQSLGSGPIETEVLRARIGHASTVTAPRREGHRRDEHA